MKIVQMISTALLWVCIGVYIYLIWSNLQIRKTMHDSIRQLQEAKNRCNDTAQRLDKALDELQKNGIEAALAVFEKEDVE